MYKLIEYLKVLFSKIEYRPLLINWNNAFLVQWRIAIFQFMIAFIFDLFSKDWSIRDCWLIGVSGLDKKLRWDEILSSGLDDCIEAKDMFMDLEVFI